MRQIFNKILFIHYLGRYSTIYVDIKCARVNTYYVILYLLRIVSQFKNLDQKLYFESRLLKYVYIDELLGF